MTLSRHPIPTHERLIVALDLPTHAQARQLVERLGDAVSFYKVGLELFMAGDYFRLIHWLTERGKKVFADLKFYDIPATVERALQALSRHPVTFATVHGNRAIMEAAARGRKGNLKILAVTVLTSLDERALEEMGCHENLETVVLRRTRQAMAAGLDGVIASGHEAPAIYAETGGKALIVTPGVRPKGSGNDDQQRVVTVKQAFLGGADHIVVGRPIRDAQDPQAAATAIQQQIAALFGTGGIHSKPGS